MSGLSANNALSMSYLTFDTILKKKEFHLALYLKKNTAPIPCKRKSYAIVSNS